MRAGRARLVARRPEADLSFVQMASVFRILFPDFAPPATIENAGASPIPTPPIEDGELDEYDREIEAAFDRADEADEAE
jgi:hypothetical protein